MAERARVLVDTSVWVDFLRGQPGAVQGVWALRRSNTIVVSGLVMQEVLQGSRDAAALAELERQFSVWEHEAEMPSDYVEAACIYAKLRWAGVTVPPSDCLIAAVAKRAELQLYAVDPDFDSIPGLRRYTP